MIIVIDIEVIDIAIKQEVYSHEIVHYPIEERVIQFNVNQDLENIMLHLNQ